MLPQKLAFVDIETTGLSVVRDRIIEIGILRVEENVVSKTYQTLINPQMYISPMIESITGISKVTLESAPTFEDVKDTITDLLADAVFVAHNVRFDYGFLKNEFLRYGQTFSSKHFCTAKLSRKLFPQYKHHNLDSIIERFHFSCERRHRAYDDAKVLWDFFQAVQQQVPLEQLEGALSIGLKKPSLPASLSQKEIVRLPQGPGVYIFYGDKQVPLYVGKSKNVKDRVLSHFSNDYTSSKEMNMCQQVCHIETIETCGELGALIKESQLIKELQPIYNRVLRVSRKLVVLKMAYDTYGYGIVVMEQVLEVDHTDIESILGIFRSRRQAKEFLLAQKQKYSLCEKLLGLEKTVGACFAYRLHTCKGACMQEEKSIAYNMRFVEAFTNYKIKSWPFGKPIVIQEKSARTNSVEHIVVDKWCLISRRMVQDDMLMEDKRGKTFDLDVYKILVRYLYDPKNMKYIKQIEQSSMDT